MDLNSLLANLLQWFCCLKSLCLQFLFWSSLVVCWKIRFRSDSTNKRYLSFVDRWYRDMFDLISCQLRCWDTNFRIPWFLLTAFISVGLHCLKILFWTKHTGLILLLKQTVLEFSGLFLLNIPYLNKPFLWLWLRRFSRRSLPRICTLGFWDFKVKIRHDERFAVFFLPIQMMLEVSLLDMIHKWTILRQETCRNEQTLRMPHIRLCSWESRLHISSLNR